MRPPPKTRSLFDGDYWERELDLFKAFGVPYTVIQSNYTMDMSNEFKGIYFMQNCMSDAAFIAGAMIKKDIKEKGIEPPEISPDDLKYYGFNVPKKLLQAKTTVYNIDIKSAYASVLSKHGLITDRTKKFLGSLQKKDRLAAVGMLASNKYLYHHDEDGELVFIENDKNPLTPFFHFCIMHTANLMEAIRDICGNDFLFYWVDGVYFENKKHWRTIEDYLLKEGYKNSFEKLTDFTVWENPRHYGIYFKRDKLGKDGKPEKKNFTIPKNDYSINKKLLDALGIFDDKNRIITTI